LPPVGNTGIDDVNCGASIRSLLRLDFSWLASEIGREW